MDMGMGMEVVDLFEMSNDCEMHACRTEIK